MSLDIEIKNQLLQYLELLEDKVVLGVDYGTGENSNKVIEFVKEIAELSSNISIKEQKNTKVPSFVIEKESEPSGITFAGVPLGHEFTSFVLALLQVSGRAPKVDDELIKRIKAIDTTLHFESYISLTC